MDVYRQPGASETIWRWEAIGGPLAHREVQVARGSVEPETDSLVTRLLLSGGRPEASPSCPTRLTVSRLVRVHEVVKVAGKRLDCMVRVMEFWRADGTPTRERRTAWLNGAVPGGVVREIREERASGQGLVPTYEARLLDYGFR